MTPITHLRTLPFYWKFTHVHSSILLKIEMQKYESQSVSWHGVSFASVTLHVLSTYGANWGSHAVTRGLAAHSKQMHVIQSKFSFVQLTFQETILTPVSALLCIFFLNIDMFIKKTGT